MRGHRARSCACACALSAAALLLALETRAEEPAPPPSARDRAWRVAAYLPNRLFDLCDIVRVHARVGTGFGAGARVTRYLPVFIGDYRAVWLGLPGPRGRAALPLPVGTEGQKGLELGPTKLGGAWHPPTYGVGEVGAGVMIYFVGLEIGFDPYELADFLAGIAIVDFAHDDF